MKELTDERKREKSARGIERIEVKHVSVGTDSNAWHGSSSVKFPLNKPR